MSREETLITFTSRKVTSGCTSMQLNVLSNPSSVLLSTHAERNSTAAPRYPQEIISAARISSSFSTCSLVNHRANMMKWPALGAPDVCGLSASPRLRSSNRRLDVGGRHMAATCHPSRPREQRGLGSVGCGAGGRPEIEAPQRPTRPASAAGSARHNTASARREWPEGGSEGLLFPPPPCRCCVSSQERWSPCQSQHAIRSVSLRQPAICGKHVS